MPSLKTSKAARRMKLFQGILPLDRARLLPDALAGLTLAAVGIPEVIGYTKIAGTPPITGLYTILLPLIAFAIFGASRHLVVAADSATAAILAASLTSIAAINTPEYLGLTGLVALTVGGLLILARFLHLGFLADFLSRSALIGFLTGVGIQVAAGEFSALFGIPTQGSNSVEQIYFGLVHLGSTHLPTLLLTLAVLGMIIGLKALAPRLPGALLAVICAIILSYAVDLKGYGITLVGEVPSGLPAIALPALQLEWNHLLHILITAISCFVLIVAQSEATARAYAYQYNEKADADTDFVGLAAANFSAALSGTFAVNGSPTKTEIVDGAGGRTQIAHLTTALIVLMVLLFLTGPLGYLPNAVLSAVVFLIGIKLIDIRQMRELYRLQRDEFMVALATILSVILFGVTAGILVAVLASLIVHTEHSYRLRTRLLIRDAQHHWQAQPVSSEVCAAPGILVYRFEAELFYANANRFMSEILECIADIHPPLQWVVVDASEINNIDYSAGKMILQLHGQLQTARVKLALVATSSQSQDELNRYMQLIKGTTPPLFNTVDEAMQRLEAITSQTSPQPT